jgi:hypothetical protein
MSWLADMNATSSAMTAVALRLVAGSVAARPRIARISPTWLSSSQPRRRPSSRVSQGSGTRSIKGAQTNFKV